MDGFQVNLFGLQIASRLLVEVGLKAVGILLMVFIGMRIAGRVANGLRLGMDRAGVDPTLSGFLRNMAHVALLAVLLVMCASLAGLPSTSLVGAIGAAGLAVGLALSSSLSNLAWGVLLIFFRPFRVGDHVLAAGIEGVVDHVNLMHVALVTMDGREAILPNAKVGSEAIINFSRRGQRRLELSVGVAYGTDISHAIAVAERTLASLPRILADPPPAAYADALGASQVDILIRGWTAADAFREAHSDVVVAIKQAFDRAGITIAFPRTDVHLVHP